MVINVNTYYHNDMSADRKINPLGLYHVYNRGNNKEFIFFDEMDRIVFLQILKKYMLIHFIIIYAYCLMGNHIHLYLDDINNNLSAFMRDVEARYAEYFNKKYKRTGHVFQGPFGSCNVIGYYYSIRVIRYIARNPIKAEISVDINSYRWSSFGESNENLKIVDPEHVKMIFQNADVDMDSYLNNNEDDKLITAIEKVRYDDDQAKQKYIEILKNEFNLQPENFIKSEVDLKMKVLVRCRYIGLSMRQLQEITNLEAGFIRRSSPRDLEYL